MGRRDDRLRDPEAFRQALMSRPIARSGAFAVFRANSDSGFRLGFVIPKKLVKKAVQRNQMKRWARDVFRGYGTSGTRVGSWVLRVSEAFSKQSWLQSGKIQARRDIRQVMETAFRK
jgi:RNase P protein component